MERFECPAARTSSIDHAEHDGLERPIMECLGLERLASRDRHSSDRSDHAGHYGLEQTGLECGCVERGYWPLSSSSPASQYNPQHDVLEHQGVEFTRLERFSDL
jgi:hypothetical protein